jgi:glutathione synthase/RimK-type ligase-like ATP-grasp enzyme
MTKRIAYLTYQEMPTGSADDQLPIPLLREQGVEVEWVIWDDSEADWRRYDALIIRSTWDYFHKIPQFRTWLDTIETTGVPLFNTVSLVRWNMDKFYLQELSQAGVPVLPAVWLRPGEKHNLSELMSAQGWDEIVLKPTVSAGGFRTERITKQTAADFQALLDEILTDNGAMIQRYAPVVADVGEWSLLFFDGEYSHSALKHPQDGDFRVQERFGGSHEGLQASEDIVAQARDLIRKINKPMLYTRVDGVVVDGRFYLMELEAFEPSLFLSESPEAPANFARALIRWLETTPEKSTHSSTTLNQP